MAFSMRTMQFLFENKMRNDKEWFKKHKRDLMYCYFTRERQNKQRQPGFFFEIYPGGFRYGCGYYQSGTSNNAQASTAVRELIERGDKTFRAARKAYESQDDILIEGERYLKSSYPEAPERLRAWLDRKSLCFVRNSVDFNLLFSNQLVQQVSADFIRMKPFYQFLRKAELLYQYEQQHKIA